jgi:hypothetical protein
MVRTDELPVALLAFIAFVVVAPIWTRYRSGFPAARPEDQVLAAAVLPAVVILFLTSWVKPELSRLALGGFMLFGVMVLAPWIFRFIDMLSGALVDDPLAQLALQLAVPLLVLSFLVSLGRRRMSA